MLKYIKNIFRKKNKNIHSSEINISEERIILDETDNRLENETLISEETETPKRSNRTKKYFSKIKSSEFTKKFLSIIRLKKLDQYILKKFPSDCTFEKVLDKVSELWDERYSFGMTNISYNDNGVF